jgi:c-di-GMP-binding flagellar brake protein YcgR
MSLKPPNQADARPLPKDLIKIGVPIAYPVYDVHGRLLLQAGMVVETEAQLEKLYANGMYLDTGMVERRRAPRKSPTVKSFESDSIKVDAPDSAAEVLLELPFKSLKLGETLQISPLNDDAGGLRYFTKYMGGLDKKSLMCTLPEAEGKVLYVKENSGFVVRLFSGKYVYRFNTMVESVSSRPYPHMHLKFPREVYSKQLRKNQRVTVSISASVLHKGTHEAENFKIAGSIIDLSLGGALIETNKLAGEIGDVLECDFKVNWDSGEALFSIPGVLRNISDNAKSDSRNLYRIGIQFGEIEFQQKLMLQNYIFQAITGEKLDQL